MNVNRWLVPAVVAVAALPGAVSAQEAVVVSGRVTDASGAPMAAATVRIDALSVGATTGADGTYRLVIPGNRVTAGQSLVMSVARQGLATVTRTVTVRGSELRQDFTVAQASILLEGVVVSALGVERDKSQLGTAQTQIGTEALNSTRATSVVNQMQGKVAGVSITGGGNPGGSNNVIIRGANSIAGNNQPLFIVDGVPVSNRGRGGGLISGFDYGNAIADINPEDIATLTVLKGPNAAAIYGSRAANGAIVITTKRGAAAGGGVRTEFSTSLTTERPSILPDFQDQYGQGAGGGFVQTADQSWGPLMDGRMICQHDSPREGGVCTPTPFIAHPNNVHDFFETGVTSQTTLAISGGSERANARLSLGYDNINGYVPGNEAEKYTALLNGAVNINNRLNAQGSFQFSRNDWLNRPGTGYSQGIMEQFFWFGRQVDINSLRNYDRTGGTGQTNLPTGLAREFNWNYNYHNNPFWIQEQNPVTDTRDRIIASGSVAYEVTDGITATLRSGVDQYNLAIEQRYAPGLLGFTNPSWFGGFTFIDDESRENNTELLLTADRNLGSRLHINALAGSGARREYFLVKSQQTNALTVPGLYTISNSAVAPTLGQALTRRHVNSVFGSLAATWNDWFTLEGTARNDWSSTLPEGENSYFYPSLSASVVLSDALPFLQNSNAINYLKIRGSVAEVGNDAAPYSLRTTFTPNPLQFNGRPQFSQGDVLANSSLKPELTRSTEFGAEVELFGGRVSFDASIYNKETRNQILNVPISPTSGFATRSINAGLVENKGYEALLSVTPIDRGSFRWTSTFNYGHNDNEVKELTEGTETVVLGGGIFGEMQLQAPVGRPLGSIYGTKFARDEAGNLLTDGGLPFSTGELEYLGSIQPDWTGGWQNEFTFRSVQLGVLFDIKQGGKIMSYTNQVGEYSGVLESSLRGREIDFDDPGILVQGIDVNTEAPNTIYVSSEDYFQTATILLAEPYVYDASYVKLRELRFGVDLPQRFAQMVGARGINLAITGRNLVTWTDVPNIDPEFAYSSGNFQGVEYGIPSNPRSIGVSFRVRP
jgi:TonB-linked SusC/RagA family outer membrane protein